MRRRLSIGALALVALLGAGCLRQELYIRSEPDGADIILNDARLGQTPYRGPFEWYGWYRLMLVKDGYERIEDRVLIESPPYLWLPFDLIAELLPFTIRDKRVLAYRLVPLTPLAEPKPPAEVPPPAADTPQGGTP